MLKSWRSVQSSSILGGKARVHTDLWSTDLYTESLTTVCLLRWKRQNRLTKAVNVLLSC